MLKNVYKGLPATLGKGAPKPETPIMPTLLQVSDLHISNFSKMVEKKLRSNETLKQWNATRKKIEEFLIAQFQLKDAELAGIDHSFAVKFYSYLTIEREKVLGEAAAKKQVKNLKEILTFAELATGLPRTKLLNLNVEGMKLIFLPWNILK